MEERELIENCLRGDGEGFRAIVETYKAPAMAVAMNILGNREDAEDACQEAFLQAFRSLGRFDRERNFKNWFLTILYRRCLDQARKKKRFRHFFARFGKETSSAASPADSPNRPERLLSRNRLCALSPKERAAVTLWANDGYTAEEISGILGCRPSTARVYLFNARKKIKALLEK
ncbi:MAG: RNA polymerase sigma factor [Candidatus Aminicenantes bacterium]|nr:RNA polymerase sigma factor [Candidatus Aminicenantes bacterium]